jgi:hypothetical protein
LRAWLLVGCYVGVTRPELSSVEPVQKEKTAEEKHRAGDQKVYRQWEPSPEPDQVPYPKCGEENSANPFPSPRDCQQDQNNIGWDQMYQKGESCFPETFPLSDRYGIKLVSLGAMAAVETAGKGATYIAI